LVIASSSAALIIWTSSGLNAGMMLLLIGCEKLAQFARIDQTQTREQLHTRVNAARSCVGMSQGCHNRHLQSVVGSS